jgi:hypothetical protein
MLTACLLQVNMLRSLCVSGLLQPPATRRLDRICGAALRAVTANFQSGHNDMKLTVSLYLPLQTIEEVALEFADFPAAKTRHVYMVALGTALIEMFFTLHVH